MARQLLIMRHAKSAWDTNARTDFERPLAKRGQKDSPRMGKWLKGRKLVPDHVISSPAERARQTAINVCKVFGVKKKKIKWDARVYGAGVEELLNVLTEAPKKAKIVLLVGHNPGLEFLFAFLTRPPSSKEREEFGVIKTATLLHLSLPEDWSKLEPGCASLVTVKNPRDLGG